MKKTFPLALALALALSGCFGSSGGSGGGNGSAAVSFTTGQDARIVLSEAGFNDASFLNTAGDGLLFNHQKGIDSDGTNLVVADANNNRVLIWNVAPTGNTSPDLVLGQPDFVQTDTNNSTDPLAQLSWPVDVASVNGKLFVTDTENDRVLVWNSPPTTNQEPADFAITNSDLLWPWGLWSDGTKLIVASTQAAKVLIWNSLPVTGTEAPDLVLTSAGEMGTPRNVTSDGLSYLMVADHDQAKPGTFSGNGTFYWSAFPNSDTASDSFIQDQASSFWMVGALDATSRLFWLSHILYRFDTTPIMSTGGMVPGDYNPDVTFDQYLYDGGDGSDMVIVGNRIYISLTNKNKIVGFSSLPTVSTDVPDFVVGSNDLSASESSLETRLGHMTNPYPVCDSKRLIVGSDFDRKIYFYDSLPTTNDQAPDFEISVAEAPDSLTLAGKTLLAFSRSQSQITIWDTVPTSASATPSRTYALTPNVTADATMDDRYLYTLEGSTISLWDVSSSWPSSLTTPDAQITLLDADTLMGTPRRISSDGTYLLVNVQDRHKILVYERSAVAAGQNTAFGSIGGTMNVQFNLPSSAILQHGKVFVADTSFHRVHVWDSLTDAISGQPAAAILGQSNDTEREPKKARDGLFMPAALAFNGKRLYVGEFKFSGRLLEFRGTR